MSSDAEMISKAILDLKNNSDFVKDYIFPVAMSFFSALLGAFFGYYLYKKQVLVGYEEVKFNAAMDAILKYNACLVSVLTIKANYKSVKTDDPIHRAMSFHRLILTNDKVNEDVLALSFILAKPEKKARWFKKRNEISEDASSWANLTRVRANLSNFNHAIALLAVRSTHDTEVREMLMNASRQDSPTLILSSDRILEIVGKEKMSTYVDLTEQCIALVDSLIKEMYSFLLFFPELVKENLNTSLIKHRGPLPTYTDERHKDIQMFTPLPKPNIKGIVYVTGMSEEEAKRRYTFGEW